MEFIYCGRLTLSYVMISCIICSHSPHWSTVPADTTPSRERQPTPTKDQHPANIYKKFCFRRDSAPLTSLLDTLLTFYDLYLISLFQGNGCEIEFRSLFSVREMLIAHKQSLHFE
jgi:hypothetical protein